MLICFLRVLVYLASICSARLLSVLIADQLYKPIMLTLEYATKHVTMMGY